MSEETAKKRAAEAALELLPEAGHFPQIERLDDVVRLLGDHVSRL